MTRDGGHDLLLAVLAMQLDFISREDVIAATTRWIRDKSEPLGQVLLRMQLLDDDEHTMLSALVAKHLQRNGDRPRRSLAMLNALQSVRSELEAFEDPVINETLAHFPSTLESGQPGAALAATMDMPTTAGSRYEVLRLHASGGLGEVFVAHDTEIHREVALKQIQEKYADSIPSRMRFMHEAEITGRLEHPGIVPVYGLGSWPDGRPYYAMRLIRGESLKTAIDRFHDRRPGMSRAEHGLALRELLGRFIDVCHAVEFAHSRGVMHRDLKPDNVMLGRHGETLVVDWGLARLTDRSEAEAPDDEPSLRPVAVNVTPTKLGSAVGTPAYMSPEQAEGRLDALGPPSDVYNLGATLFCLLTGQPPCPGGDMAEVLSQVRNGDFSAPRKVEPSVPQALEAICLKAMALRPEHRYASPRALAEDLERWLGDEAVSAYSAGVVERVSRWFRHHRTAATAAGVLMLTALIALSIGTVLLNAANARTELQREIAVSSGQLAQENFRNALDTVDQYLTTVSESQLIDKPGLQSLRKELLEQAHRYYEEFARTRADDPLLQAELAGAKLRVAQIKSMIESEAAARPYYEEAVVALRRLAGNSGTVPVLLLQALVGLCSVEDALGNYAGAITAGNEAVEIGTRLAGTVNDEALSAHLAHAHLTRGYAFLESGNAEAATQDFQACVELVLSFTEQESPVQDKSRRLAAAGYLSLGLTRRAAGDRAGAIRNYEQSLEITNALAEKYPDVPNYQNNAAKAYHNLGLMQVETGQTDLALASIRRAVELGERLTRENPLVVEYRADVVRHYDRLGNLLRRAGRGDEAVEPYSQGIRLCESLVDDHPAVPEFRQQLASLSNNSGNLYRELDNPEKAEESYRRAAELRVELLDELPGAEEIRATLATTYNNLAVIQSDPADSVHWLQLAIATQQDLADANPEQPDLRHELARSYANLAHFEFSRKHLDDALQAADRAVELEDELVANHPEVEQYRLVLAIGLANRSEIRWERGEKDLARTDLGRALEVSPDSIREDLLRLREQQADPDA